MNELLFGIADDHLAADGSYDHAKCDPNENIFIPNKKGLNLASTCEASVAFKYSYVAEFLIKQFLQYKEVKVLDIGCSKATFLHFWKAFYNPGKKPRLSYTGVDVREKAIEFCRETFPASTFHLLDVTEAEIPEAEQFDVAFVMDIIEHVPKALGPKLLDAAWKSLKDDGFCVVSMPNPKKEIGQQLTNLDDHVFEWSYMESVELLGQHGFELVDSIGWFGQAAYITMGFSEEEQVLYKKLSRAGAGLRMAVMSFLRPDLAECYVQVCRKIPKGQAPNHELSSYQGTKAPRWTSVRRRERLRPPNPRPGP